MFVKSLPNEPHFPICTMGMSRLYVGLNASTIRNAVDRPAKNVKVATAKGEMEKVSSAQLWRGTDGAYLI